LLAKTFEAFGAEEVEGEPHYHKHIRNIAINWACQAHLESCISATHDKFKEFMEAKRVGFSSDHESSIFCNGILMAKREEFDFMWNLYNGTTEASRRSFYLRSMGCIEDDEILTTLIDTTLSSDIDNANDEWFTIITAVYSNGPKGLSVTLRFLRENYDAFIGL
jgi:ERAP1-like C-terminal domain